MKIEAGKYYKTQKGDKVGPAKVNELVYPWNIPHGPDLYFYAYTSEGYSCLGNFEHSIKEEWKEPEEMATETQNVEHRETYKVWGEMTPEEKGTLLLAHHEGKTIEYLRFDDVWAEDSSPFAFRELRYRIKPEEPSVEEKVFDVVYLASDSFPFTFNSVWGCGNTKGTATVTYTDGKPTKMVWECDSTAI